MIDLNRAKLRLEAEALDPTLPAIVVGHAHLFGARIGAERLLTMGSDPMYDLQTFDLPGVDFVALGHIHKHQVLQLRHAAGGLRRQHRPRRFRRAGRGQGLGATSRSPKRAAPSGSFARSRRGRF